MSACIVFSRSSASCTKSARQVKAPFSSISKSSPCSTPTSALRSPTAFSTLSLTFGLSYVSTAGVGMVEWAAPTQMVNRHTLSVRLRRSVSDLSSDAILRASSWFSLYL